MEERKSILLNEVIEGVQFHNLPAYIEATGKISYPLNAWTVAELVATKIPEDIRANVTVDFNTVDIHHFLAELNDGETVVKSDVEQKLLLYIHHGPAGQ